MLLREHVVQTATLEDKFRGSVLRKSHKQDKEKADRIPKGTDYQGKFTGFDRKRRKNSTAYKILLA